MPATRWVSIATGAVVLASVGLGSLIGFAWIYPFDPQRNSPGLVSLAFVAFLMRTFTLHAGLGLGLFGGILALMRRRWPALVVTLAALACVLPAAIAARPRIAPELTEPTLTIASANLRYKNPSPEAAAKMLAELDVEILFIQEYTPRFDELMGPTLRAAFPHHVIEPRPTPLGQAVFSRRPLDVAVLDRPPLASKRHPTLRVSTTLGEREVTFFNLHLLWQTGPKASKQYRALLGALQREGATVALGDFNFNEWSGQHRAIVDLGLTDAFEMTGGGLKATWPNDRWRQYIVVPKIRIDHIYLSEQLGIASLDIRRIPGSDHAAIITTLGFRP